MFPSRTPGNTDISNISSNKNPFPRIYVKVWKIQKLFFLGPLSSVFSILSLRNLTERFSISRLSAIFQIFMRGKRWHPGLEVHFSTMWTSNSDSYKDIENNVLLNKISPPTLRTLLPSKYGKVKALEEVLRSFSSTAAQAAQSVAIFSSHNLGG